MKKFIRILCAMSLIAMLVSCLCVPTSAAVVDWSDKKLEPLVQMLNGYIETSDELLPAGMHTMRGFSVSPDGRFAFCGFLNPKGTSGITVIDLETALPVGSWQHTQTDGGVSYPKGIAVDDRGYCYIGAAYQPNYGVVDYAITSYDDKGELTEIGFYNAVTESTAGDESGTKIGVNGVKVAKSGDKYYMYMIINYGVNRLYRFDVTDVKNPALDTTFGTNGYVDLTVLLQSESAAANYLDIDSEGYIYMAATGNEGTGLYILAADGNSVFSFVELKKAYSVAVTDDYIYVTVSSGPSAVYVLDRVTLATVATLAGHDGANYYVNVLCVNDCLYVADQGSDTQYSSILTVPLTDAAKAVDSARKAAYAAALETTVADTTTAPTPEDTHAPADDTTTAEPDNTTTATPTTTPTPTEPDVTTTTADDTKGGCGSVVALGLMACLIPAAVIVCRKKD